MKSLILSVKPKHCANILNGLKTKEIRKRFPKEYRGWIYIYCTKDSTYGLFEVWDKECYEAPLTFIGYYDISRKQYIFNGDEDLNGKVVARFWCDNVEEINIWNIIEKDWHLKSCLSNEELIDYLEPKDYGYAINITKLEIFDEPKELSEFYKIVETNISYDIRDVDRKHPIKLSACKKISKAPQSMMYIEIDN